MARRGKVIVSCAVTGSIHVPRSTDYLPITPDEIAEGAIGAAEAGAAIVHLHARDPRERTPDPRPEVFAEFLPEIRHGCDAVINITTGGGHGMTLDERSAAARAFEPELCSMNMGSMNFGLFPMLDRMRVQAPLGARLPRDVPGLHLPEHLQGHRAAWSPSSARTAPGSSSSATTSVTSTTSPTSSTAGW